MNYQIDWDDFSDQPHIIRDKSLKREIYKKSAWDSFKLLLTNIFIFPFVILNFFLYRKNSYRDICENKDIFALGISLENQTHSDMEKIKELGVKKLLIRFPLSKIDEIKKYKEFIKKYHEYEIVINLMQDRYHIEDLKLLKRDLKIVFKEFESIKEYQIGTTINRKKWGFFSVDEYLRFFEVAKSLRDEEFLDIKLIGSSVIDFEYHFTIRSLFNFYKVYYDRFSALLYVDRRGSPFSTQMGFDLYKKINLLFSIVSLSSKSNNTIYITETNWPISNTAPYAPTSEKECVNVESYAEYMVVYYLIAIASKRVARVYWHQLNAKGYGLINNVDNIIYPAFYSYKYMVKSLKNKKLIEFDINHEIKEFRFENVTVFYHENGFDEMFIKENDLDINGKEYKGGRILYRWNKSF